MRNRFLGMTFALLVALSPIPASLKSKLYAWFVNFGTRAFCALRCLGIQRSCAAGVQ